MSVILDVFNQFLKNGRSLFTNTEGNEVFHPEPRVIFHVYGLKSRNFIEETTLIKICYLSFY